MLRISLHNAGKRYNRNWIFRNVNFEIPAGESLAVLGENGSGKSTLLQLISGHLSPSEGNITYFLNEQEMDAEKIYTKLSIAAPYLELIEEFSLTELITFHAGFKSFLNGKSAAGVIKTAGLESSSEKQIRYFSSGMKQRVRLALAILSDVPLVLLDEPLTNLDAEGTAWYKKLIADYSSGRTVVVCSNKNEDEFFFCNKSIHMQEYKSETMNKVSV